MKEQRFEKVVKYYFPNGDKLDTNIIGFCFWNILIMICLWILYPIVFFVEKAHNIDRKVYWRKMK